jgi:hypothetical protein
LGIGSEDIDDNWCYFADWHYEEQPSQDILRLKDIPNDELIPYGAKFYVSVRDADKATFYRIWYILESCDIHIANSVWLYGVRKKTNLQDESEHEFVFTQED